MKNYTQIALATAVLLIACTQTVGAQTADSMQAEIQVLKIEVSAQAKIIGELADRLDKTRDQVAHIMKMQGVKEEVQNKKLTALKNIFKLHHEKSAPAAVKPVQ